MAKNSISQFSTAAASNTDIAGINVNTGWVGANVGQAFRELMAMLAQQNTGVEPWNSLLIENASGTTGSWLINTDTSSPANLVLSQLNAGGTVIATPLSVSGSTGDVLIGNLQATVLQTSGLPPGINYGDVKDSALLVEAFGWRLCYGQTRPRTDPLWQYLIASGQMTYWVWGTGDGSTTYTMPDFRGKGRFGLDNMGGTAANLITLGGSNLDGASLGAYGGSQSLTSHGHIAISSATSTVNDPGHSHAEVGVATNNLIGSTYMAATKNASSAATTSQNTASAATGITVSTTVTTAVSNDGSGNSANIPPAAIVATLMYVGA